MLPALELQIPVATPRVLNGSHGWWRTVAKRNYVIKSTTYFTLCAAYPPGKPVQLPVLVTLTRRSYGRPLDPDGLAAALKYVQDAVAKWLGVDDGDASSVAWRYRSGPAPKGKPSVVVHVQPGARVEENIIEARK